MIFNIKTTGTLGTVVIRDLGNRTFVDPFPAIGYYDLGQEYTDYELMNSADLQAAITAGTVLVRDVSGNFITDLSQLGGLQAAYNNSTSLEIHTSTSLGPVSIRRGTATDADIQFAIENSATTKVFSITAEGDVLGSTFNGVALAIGGSGGSYLDDAGGYTTPPDSNLANKSLIQPISTARTYNINGTSLTFKKNLGNDFLKLDVANNDIIASESISLLDERQIRFYDSGSLDYTGFNAPSSVTGGPVMYTLPTADAVASPTVSQVLSSDGAGTLSWIDNCCIPLDGDDEHPDDGELLVWDDTDATVVGLTGTEGDVLQADVDGKPGWVTPGSGDGKPLVADGIPTDGKFTKFDASGSVGDSSISEGATEVTMSKKTRMTKQSYGDIGTIEVSSLTATVDFDNANSQTIDLENTGMAGALVLSASNEEPGATYFIKIIQGQYNNSITWPVGTKWPGGIPIPVSTGDGDIDTVVLFCDGAGSFLANFANNYRL